MKHDIDLRNKCGSCAVGQKLLTERQLEIIPIFAEHDMNIARTARALHIRHVSLTNLLNRIRDKTGLDPRRFYDLCELLREINHAKESNKSSGG